MDVRQGGAVEARVGQKAGTLGRGAGLRRKAQQMRLAWSRPHVLQGEIWRQRGNDEQALDQYLQASINGDRDLEFIRLLLQMLFERQRLPGSRAGDSPAGQRANAPDPRDRQGKGPNRGHLGRFRPHPGMSGSAYNPASDDYREHVWHGQVLKLLARRAQREGHQDKLAEIARQAEKSFRRACQIAPNAAECRVGLVQLLVATDQRDKARIAANDAKEMISLRAETAGDGIYLRGPGREQTGGRGLSKGRQRPAGPAPGGPKPGRFLFAQRDIRRATPLIERVLSGKLPSSESDLVSARRMMAAILVNQGYSKGYSKMKEAARLVDRNLESTLAQPEDKRLKILILLADPRQARGPDVLELAESLVNKGAAEPEPDDRLQLALGYLARGDWEHCREQMEKLVNGTQSNPHYLAAYVRMLLDQDNQLSDADMWLERLEKAAASNPGLTVDLHAELRRRRKEWGKVPGLPRRLRQPGGRPTRDGLDRMLVAAQCVNVWAAFVTARPEGTGPGLLRQGPGMVRILCPGTSPAGAMLLAALHARRRSLPRSILAAGRRRLAPRHRRQLVRIHCENITARQLQRVEKVLPSPWRRRKRRSRSSTALASCKTSQGNSAAAEDLCRQMLAKDPRELSRLQQPGRVAGPLRKQARRGPGHGRSGHRIGRPAALVAGFWAVVARRRAAKRPGRPPSIAADKPDPVWLLHKARA